MITKHTPKPKRIVKEQIGKATTTQLVVKAPVGYVVLPDDFFRSLSEGLLTEYVAPVTLKHLDPVIRKQWGRKKWRMSIKKTVAPKITEPKPLAEHSRVAAVSEIHEEGTTIPVGAVGTVVNVVRGGVGYDVEFTTPIHAVVAATRAELTPAE